jgi:hypothetical protein
MEDVVNVVAGPVPAVERMTALDYLTCALTGLRSVLGDLDNAYEASMSYGPIIEVSRAVDDAIELLRDMDIED